MGQGDLTVVSSDPLPLSVVSSQPLGSNGPDITNPEAMLAQSHTQAQQVIGNAADQMHGMVSFMGQPPASIATEKGFEDAAASPAPVPKTIGGALGGTPPKVYPGQEQMAQVAEKVPQIAQSLSAFSPVGATAELIDKAIPNASRAGQAFNELSESIGTHPVAVTDDLSKSIGELKKASETTNTNLPPVVRKLIDRLDPFQGGGPLNYDDARSFSSEINALSAADKMSLTANTKRLIGNLNQTLKATVQDTADSAGFGQKLSDAMSEFHHAMQVRGMSEQAIKQAWQAALGGLGVYGAKKIWDASQ